MNLSIEYTNEITPNNNNIVIFVSNLSQLKNIDFLPNLNNYIKDKEFLIKLNSNKYVLISNIQIKKKITNIFIVLLKFKPNNSIEIGALLNKKFNQLKENKCIFIFSKILLNNKKIVSDLIFGFSLHSYTFNKYIKSQSNKRFKLFLYNLKEFKDLKYNLNLLKSINFTKDLISEPANIINPITYSEKCIELKKIGLKVKILNKEQLEKIGMRSILGVAQGSIIEPRVVIFEWNLKKKVKPTVLVGKGVTFDSGGISLKPAGGMEDMITDMSGSAVVVGSMINAALNKSSKSLLGVIGLVENMPDGNAQRPGDIVKSLSGKTIEVLNTDAEGRLVLADLLTYIQNKYKPQHIIDFATLTGAIMIALGVHRAGLFSNNNNLSKKLELSGEISGEKLWRMPLSSEYDNEINSLRADMKNIGSTRYGGAIQAAQFIQRFIKNDTSWAHIDIAGVSWSHKGGNNSFSKLHSPGATAFGVRLIDQFLKG